MASFGERLIQENQPIAGALGDSLISGICLWAKSVFPKKSYRVER